MTQMMAPLSSTAPDADPFRFGWRYRTYIGASGLEETDILPLTLADLLHPEEGDHEVHSRDHERFCIYIHDVFADKVRHDPTAMVLHDMRVAWGDPEIEAHGPDIAVFFGVQERKNWRTFDCAVEQVMPALLLEVTSPETRRVDLYEKLDEYGQLGIAWYFIVDSFIRRGEELRRLMAYRHNGMELRPVDLDERGWVWIEPIGVYLGLDGNEVRLYERDGTPIDDYVERSATLAAAQAEAVAVQAEAVAAQAEAGRETRAREAAEARVAELEQELRRLRDQG